MIISRFPQKAAPQSGFTYTGNYEVVEDAGGYKIRLLSSGVFTPNADMQVDLFAVGGGSGGFGGKDYSGSNPNGATINTTDGKTYTTYPYTYQVYEYGGGGSGGFTNTLKNVTLEAGTNYFVVIGKGGAGGTRQTAPGAGGSTSLGEIISAAGGQSRNDSDVCRGANGGNGGGVGHQYETKRYSTGGTGRGSRPGGKGGSDGSDGFGSNPYRGIGQHTTTREFAEASGALYAGAGGGGWHWEAIQAIDYQGGEGGGGNGCHWNGSSRFIPAESGAANTGGGGGGGSKDYAGGSGGSGILIIRNARGE